MDYFPVVCDSPLVWSWVIEALATSRVVELDLICDLIETNPKLWENLNEAAREIVALRNLEALYDPVKVLNSGSSLPSDQEDIQFDSSECFSSVLQRVMDQASVPSLRKDASDPLSNVRKGASGKLMREAHAFIKRRKASLPKCALQELSDILQNGDVCHETELRRERSCLQTRKRMKNFPVDVQCDKSPPEKNPRRDNNGFIASTEQISALLISSDMQDCPADVESGKLSRGKEFRHYSNGSIASREKNSAPLTSSGIQDWQADVESVKSALGKKLRNDSNGSISSTEQNAAPSISSDMQDYEVDAESGKSPPGKKLRYDNSVFIASTKPNSPPLNLSGMQDCPLGGQSGKSPPGRGPRHDNNGSFAATEQNSAPLHSSDVYRPYPVSWKPAEPIGLLMWRPCDASSEIEKSHAENSSTPAESTELDVCIKCNKDGDVLICSASSCPVVVHQRCLGFSANIYNRDDFLCPFCACSSAKSEYAEAKEKMFLAREKLSLFVCGNPDLQSNEFTTVNLNPRRQHRDERVVNGKGVHPVDQTSSDNYHEGHLPQNNVHTSLSDCCQLEREFAFLNAFPPRQGSGKATIKGKGVYQVDQVSTDKQHKSHLGRDNVHTSHPNCSSKGGGDIPEQSCLSNKQHQGHLEPDNVRTSPRNCASKEGEDVAAKNAGLQAVYDELAQEQHDSPSKNASREFSGKLSGNPEAENHTANPCSDLTPQSQSKLVDQMQGASSASLDDCDGISEEENYRAPTSRYPQRVKGVCPARRPDRRIRVPWTEKEVEMLKEGMKRFGSKDMKIIPWTTILEFGSSVFWKGRTGVDLKDKWRNLVKANPEVR